MAKNCRSGAKWEENVDLNTANNAVSGQPVLVSQLIGTVETAEVAGHSVVNCAANAVYEHPVRNVRTYDQTGGEATWGAIAEGDYIYIDLVSALPAGVYLSTSPLNDLGVANKIFGKAQTADATAIAKTCTIDVQQVQV